MSTSRFLSATLFAAALAAQSPLETTFVGGLHYSATLPPGISQYFDVSVVNPAGIVIYQIDVNLNALSNPSGGFDVWVTPPGGTHVANERIAALWTRVSSTQYTRTGTGRQSILLSQPFYLAPGTYGVTLHNIGLDPNYTNPVTPTPPLPPTYFNADLTIDMSAARSRASLANDPFGGTAAGFSPRHANIALHYNVGSVSVDFTSDVTGGVSPLAVQFTGIGISGNPGGVLGWAWDFENDGIVDSTVQSPSHTYPCGDFDVSLTIVDASGTYNETKMNYIRTDILSPDFSYTALSPTQMQFNDLTTPAPTSWAWDLNGDGVTDSTLQNPTFTYANRCAEVDITLTVARACKPAVTESRSIAVAKNLTTVFGGGTFTVSGATGGINFFDLQVTNPLGVTICAMHVHNQLAANNPLTLNLHLTPGTYIGNETTPDPWQLVATATVAAGGGGQQTFVPFAQGVYIPAGSYGVALEHVGHSPRYTNLGGTMVYSNADMTLTAGATQAEPVFSTGTIFSPRVANVAFYYGDCAFSSDAGYGWFGSGCPSSLGVVSSNTATALPRLGQTLTAQISDLPIGVGFFMFGLSRTSSIFGPLPIDLTLLGAPGCFGRVSPDANSLLLTQPAGTATFNLAIPNSPILLCTQFFTQGLVLDNVNALGAVVSDAAAGIIGQ